MVLFCSNEMFRRIIWRFSWWNFDIRIPSDFHARENLKTSDRRVGNISVGSEAVGTVLSINSLDIIPDIE